MNPRKFNQGANNSVDKEKNAKLKARHRQQTAASLL